MDFQKCTESVWGVCIAVRIERFHFIRALCINRLKIDIMRGFDFLLSLTFLINDVTKLLHRTEKNI